jgi:hypothetical protein
VISRLDRPVVVVGEPVVADACGRPSVAWVAAEVVTRVGRVVAGRHHR